jgi:hypothetical protein
MSGQSIALATKGIICMGGDRIIRRVLPLHMNLLNTTIKLNLKYLETIKLNTFLDQKKLSLKLDDLKLSQKFTNNLKLNLKKCEE